MKQDPDDKSVTLSTGTRLSTGGMGLPFSVNEFGEVNYGYDGGVYIPGVGETGKLTPDERKEIADYHIDLWRKWANGN